MPDHRTGSELLRHVFVYGTLKRGQCREQCWPAKPLSIRDAEVRGTLFDLGPFPALQGGDGRVSGEVWEFAQEDMTAVLATTDAIEGFNNSPSDLYQRTRVLAIVADGEVEVWTYLLRAAPSASKRIDEVPARWPFDSAKV